MSDSSSLAEKFLSQFRELADGGGRIDSVKIAHSQEELFKAVSEAIDGNVDLAIGINRTSIRAYYDLDDSLVGSMSSVKEFLVLRPICIRYAGPLLIIGGYTYSEGLSGSRSSTSKCMRLYHIHMYEDGEAAIELSDERVLY
ncbi:hypothetical protein CR969_02395 [Candidatus Saccharibacteria bacterium]|nr:MAG: hypothetical protein CR969_02395 [Candidatus Saccharibacteria bacterium]